MSDRYCVLQDDLKDCGVCCLLSIIKFYNGNISREYLKELTKTTRSGVSALNIIKAARELGFESFGIKGKLKDLKINYLPVIAHVMVDKKFGHFVVIYKIDMKKNQILIMDPSKGFVTYSFSNFMQISTNYYLILKKKHVIPNLVEEEKNVTNIIYPLLMKYKHVFITVILFSFLYTILNVISSYHFKLFYEEYVSLSQLDLKTIFIILLALIIFKCIVNLLRNHLINYFNLVLDKTLVKDAFHHIIHLPYLYYKNHTNGDLLTRINDLGNIKELISNLFISIFVDVTLAIFILIMLFKIHFSLTMIVISGLCLYGLIVFLSNKSLQSLIKESFNKSSNVNNCVVESLASFETIKNLSIQDHICKKFNKDYVNWTLINQNLISKINTQSMWKNMCLLIVNLLIIYLGILKIKNNLFNVSALITFMTLSNYLIDPIKNILDLQLSYLNSKESIRRIKEIYQIPSENQLLKTENNLKKLKGSIIFSDVSYSYNAEDYIFRNIKMEIKEGEKVLIYGDSGCGKSTLMQLLIKYLDNNYRGDIYIDGFNLNDISVYSLRKNICYVSQNEYLYTDSVYKNIVLDKKIPYKEFLTLTKHFYINEIVQNTVMGYNYLIENNGENISGGEKARILLARSALRKANIYIYDETFSSIDVNKERKILEYLFNKHPNKTFIVISHRISNEDLFNQKILFGGDANGQFV